VIWQFQHNRAMGITADGPKLLTGPDRPLIAQGPLPPALPPPASAQPLEPQSTALIDRYALTPAGVKALANEAYKIKSALPVLDILREASDGTSVGLASQIVTALNRGGIVASTGFGHLAGPSETGLIILAEDPEHLAEPAAKLKQALENIGLTVHVLQRKMVGFQFFVGPDPNS
jgi:hypothetical protein